MSSNKVLFICQDYTLASEGQNVVTKRNLRILRRCGLEVDQIMIKVPGMLTKLKNLVLGQSYGYSSDVKKEVEKAMKNDYQFVFFDRSIFGTLIRRFSKKGYRTICFFHNVETHLSEKRYKVTKNPFYWVFYRNISHNEKITTQYADTVIAISERDQKELRETYSLDKVHLMPTSFEPALPEYTNVRESNGDNYCLFVGSDFFANQEGMGWFVREVAPHISVDIRVVGSICNSLSKMNLPANVRLEGYVDDINEYYANAMCVVSPIFTGSGLKTKTIEALRFGKTIFGSDEAFAGIQPVLFNKIGKLCNTKEEYIDAINEYAVQPKLVNEGSVNVFNSFFSDDIAFSTLKSIIMQ